MHWALFLELSHLGWEKAYSTLPVIISLNTAQKMKFSLSISSVNVTKSAVSCGFSHIYWRNPQWKTSFFVQCNILVSVFILKLSILNNNSYSMKLCHFYYNLSRGSFRVKIRPILLDMLPWQLRCSYLLTLIISFLCQCFICRWYRI